jgi:Helix-turn-helix domain
MSAHVEVSHFWAPIPQELLYDATISADAVRVFGVLHRHGTDPTNCYPSHARIAELIGRSKRSVPGWIKELADAGWVEVIPRRDERGDQMSNAYRVMMMRAGERAPRAGERGGVPATERVPPALVSAPKESNRTRASKNEKERPPAPVSALPGLDPFDAFWDIYPRRAGKGDARKAFERATHRSPVAEVMAGAARYRDDPNREAEFTAHPATWLNQDRWEDDPLPAKHTNGQPPREHHNRSNGRIVG